MLRKSRGTAREKGVDIQKSAGLLGLYCGKDLMMFTNISSGRSSNKLWLPIVPNSKLWSKTMDGKWSCKRLWHSWIASDRLHDKEFMAAEFQKFVYCAARETSALNSQWRGATFQHFYLMLLLINVNVNINVLFIKCTPISEVVLSRKMQKERFVKEYKFYFYFYLLSYPKYCTSKTVTQIRRWRCRWQISFNDFLYHVQ